jgi:hypothetical protein
VKTTLTLSLAISQPLSPFMLAQAPIRPLTHSLFSAEQSVPGAIQGALDAEQRGQQDIELARLDFLHGANVQIDQFRQSFLRQPAGCALPTHVRAKPIQLRCDLFAERHGPLRRENTLDGNGLIGRNLIHGGLHGVEGERG